MAYLYRYFWFVCLFFFSSVLSYSHECDNWFTCLATRWQHHIPYQTVSLFPVLCTWKRRGAAQLKWNIFGHDFVTIFMGKPMLANPLILTSNFLALHHPHTCVCVHECTGWLRCIHVPLLRLLETSPFFVCVRPCRVLILHTVFDLSVFHCAHPCCSPQR